MQFYSVYEHLSYCDDVRRTTVLVEAYAELQTSTSASPELQARARVNVLILAKYY